MKTLTLEYAVFKLKLFGADDYRLTVDNCIGYGSVVGEEWVGNYAYELEAENVIARHGDGKYIIKKVYVVATK